MNKKGFGQSQPTKTEKLIQQIVKHCQKRSPESLDQIFDNLSVGLTRAEFSNLNQQVMSGTVKVLSDSDTLAWFCSYFASEINRSEDNDKSRHPIRLLSKLLIKHGMEPFTDFSPYPGCRLVITNIEKFESLPIQVQELVKEAFQIIQRTSEQARQINDALLEELIVMSN